MNEWLVKLEDGVRVIEYVRIVFIIFFVKNLGYFISYYLVYFRG